MDRRNGVRGSNLWYRWERYVSTINAGIHQKTKKKKKKSYQRGFVYIKLQLVRNIYGNY